MFSPIYSKRVGGIGMGVSSKLMNMLSLSTTHTVDKDVPSAPFTPPELGEYADKMVDRACYVEFFQACI